MITLMMLLTLVTFTQKSVTLQVHGEGSFLLAMPKNGKWSLSTIPPIKKGANLIPLGIMRGIKLGVLEVTDSVREVTVTFSEDPWSNPPREALSPSFLRIFKKILINPPEVSSTPTVRSWPLGARYIIIVANSLWNSSYEYLLSYMDWKSREGFMPLMVPLSEIGETPEDIKNYLNQAYHTWPVPPEYVLLVGDPEILPAHTYPDPGGCGGTYVSDNYYATVDGEDNIADLFVGRFSVLTSIQLNTVIEKSLKIDRDPDLSDPNYFKRAVFMAGDAYEPDTIYYSPKWFARGLLDEIGFVQVDTFFVTPEYIPSSSDVLEAITEGCQFMNFRANSGGLPAYPFNDVVPEGVNNGWKLPIYVAISCLLGNFDMIDPSYDEMWLRAGSPSAPKGAVAVISSSGCSVAGQGYQWFHTIRRNAVDKGIFKAFTVDSLWHLGDAFNVGKLRVYQECPMPIWAANYHYSEVNIQGDPTLNVWTDTPSPLETSYPTKVLIEDPTFTVSVHKNGFPLKGAVVCVKEDSTFCEINQTNENGEAEFRLGLVHLGLMDITISAQNALPDTGRILVTSENSPFLYPTSYFLKDTIQGNGDSIPNPGEEIALTVALTNAGGAAAFDTRVMLSSDSPYISVVDSIDTLGEVLPGDTVITNRLSFNVSSCTPDNELFNLILGIEAANSPPISFTYPLRAHSPRLLLDSVLVFDSGDDYFLDPSDNASIVVFLSNKGSAPTESLSLHLFTQNPYIFVKDSIGYMASIPPNGSGFNQADELYLAVSDSAPPGETADFTLSVANRFGFEDTLSFSLRIGGRDFLVYNPVTGLSYARIIPDLLDSIGYKGVYVEKWNYYRNKLFSFKTVWITLGAPPHDAALNDSSDVKALINYLDGGGKLYLEGARVGHNTSQEVLSLVGITDVDYSPCPQIVIGVGGVFTQGFAYGYEGGFFTVDKFTGIAPDARVILRAENGGENSRDVGVAYPKNNYRTVISSVEIGRLIDSLATKEDLLEGLMNFLLKGENIKERGKQKDLNFKFISLLPNPSLNKVSITFSVGRREKVSLDIFDSSGRLVYTPLQKTVNKGIYSFKIRLRGRHTLPQGVYFLRLKTDEESQIKKLIILH